jgi:hypothetical protein
MITLKELSAAITGAVYLAKGDIVGLDYFDASERGFWRSFWAALIVAPAWVLLLALDEEPMTAGAVRMILVQTIDYALLWTAFPLVLYEILARARRTERFYLYASIHNWASVIETPAMLFAAGFAVAVPSPAAGLLPVLVMVVIFAYEWFIARVGLAVGLGAAAGVATMDLILSIVIQLVADAMLGVGAATGVSAAN